MPIKNPRAWRGVIGVRCSAGGYFRNHSSCPAFPFWVLYRFQPEQKTRTGSQASGSPAVLISRSVRCSYSLTRSFYLPPGQLEPQSLPVHRIQGWRYHCGTIDVNVHAQVRIDIHEDHLVANIFEISDRCGVFNGKIF